MANFGTSRIVDLSLSTVAELLQSKYLLGLFLVRFELSRRACGAGLGLEGGLGVKLVDVGGSCAALSLMNFPFRMSVWPASA